APRDRHAAETRELGREVGGEALALSADAREPRAHVDVVDGVDGAPADRVVRMVLEQRPPERPQGLAVRATAERVERLAALPGQPFARWLLLFEPHARGAGHSQ